MSRVSVIIPVYNVEPYVDRAIDSVLAQTLKPANLVLVDDQSTDRTAVVICDRFGFQVAPVAEAVVNGDTKVRLIRKRHTNLPNTRNVGMLSVFAETDYFAFLDGDDWYDPAKLSKSVAAFALDPSIVCVVSDYDNHHTSGGKVLREYKPSFDARRLTMECLHNINCVVSAEAIKKIGLFDESLTYCEDYDLFLRLSEIGCIYHIPEVLHHRLVRGTNMSNNLDAMSHFDHLVKQRAIQRRTGATR